MAKKIGKSTKKKQVKSASKPRVQLQAGAEIWPLERDVLFRPDRFKYVRKLIKPEGCVFCHPAKTPASFESLCVYKSEHSMIVLNKFPYNTGHILILPRSHCGDLLALNKKEFVDLNETVLLAVSAIKELYQPAGFNLGLNHGAVAGAGIPEHLHYHLIPRWSGDLNFFPLIAETKVVIENLEQTYDRLSGYFKNI